MDRRLILPWLLKKYIFTLQLGQAAAVLNIRIRATADCTNRDLRFRLNDWKPGRTCTAVGHCGFPVLLERSADFEVC
ncbi:hypothetical protein D3C87_1995580 [compost metagenome]